jgi:WD40 repeat protein
MLSTLMFLSLVAQAPPPTQGVPYTRLVWGRIADLNGELGSVECAEFSPDNRFIATATKYGNDISVWRVNDGALVWSFKAEQEVERVAFSPDGKFLAAGGEDDLLRLFDPATGKLLQSIPHNAGIDSLRWSPDGTLIATGQEDGLVRLWRAPAFQQVAQFKIEGAINELDFTADQKLLAVIGDKSGVRLLRVPDLSLVRVVHRANIAPTIAGRFSPTQDLIAAAGHEGNIFIWRASTGEFLRQINFTGQKIETVGFSPDGQYLLYAGHDPHIRVIRISDWNLVHLSQPVDHAEYVAFSRNGSFLASAHQDGVVRLWVWMRGDPFLNKRLHNQLMQKQDEEDAAKATKKPR